MGEKVDFLPHSFSELKKDPMKRTKSILVIIVMCVVLCANFLTINAQNNLLPFPKMVNWNKGKFDIKKVSLQTTIVKKQWTDFISEIGGEFSITASRSIVVEVIPDFPNYLRRAARLAQVSAAVLGSLNSQVSDEAYRLTVTNKKIHVRCGSSKGAYWAMQTLRQLHNEQYFKNCDIIDWPAFKIRGFMHDVARSFISLKELKREIAILSQYKINTFHWHLTENSAWRLESKKYPELTAAENMTRFKGKYYTQKEAQELMSFCKEHQVLLIPEIDIPGHSAAFTRAFGCDMQSHKGTRILKSLIDEVCEIFDDVPYIHIGTDEVKFRNPHFVPQMVTYIRAKGKKVISWNPGWNYNPGEIDMLQLWSSRGKSVPGIPVIDSKFHYLNHYDTFADLIALYTSRIYNQNHGSPNLAGVILCVWNDRLLDSEAKMLSENNFYPCMLAIADRSWQGGGYQYFDKSGTQFPKENTFEFAQFVDFEQRMLWHKAHVFKGYPFIYVKQSQEKWAILEEPFNNKGNLKQDFDCTNKKFRVVRGGGIYLRHVWGRLVPSFYKSPKENSTSYAYTYVYSPKKQDAGLWAEFQNYSRSEMDLPPKEGVWDYKGSRIWINDEEVMPPVWVPNHLVKSHDIALGNENCVSRLPIKVLLKKGWNKIWLKLPIGNFSTPEVRLQKWMFTVAFVTLDGQEAIPNLIYNPNHLEKTK